MVQIDTFTREEVIAMLAQAGGEPLHYAEAYFAAIHAKHTQKLMHFVQLVADNAVARHEEAKAP